MRGGGVERIDCVVIGAGVIGLAAARALALRGHEVVVLEAQGAIGSQTSSRNSEVIHAGLYYAPGSLKARLCVQGRGRLYAYCDAHRVAHRRCGKLIVATDADQVAALDRIEARGRANGVDDLRRLSARQATALEPALHCVAALLSPSTGIIDSHGLMLALQGDAQDHGAMVALKSPVLRGRACAGGIELDVGGEQPMSVLARRVVNSAGLQAPAVAASIDGLDRVHAPQARYCKGSYFALGGRAPFTRLVYPVPDEAGLGVHLTLDLAGQARFGPDTEWLEPGQPIDYDVDARRAEGFDAAIRRYWPGLPAGALVPAYSGVRPKIVGPGEPAADFTIQGPDQHGVEGLVNLFGIESPGLTASIAIGEYVARQLLGPPRA
jgi:L-2-hydroxyglutarate oxidase LhgO